MGSEMCIRDRAVREHLTVENGLLKYNWVGGNALLVVPQSMRLAVLKLGHDNAFAGHFGIRKTDEKIRSPFFWLGMGTKLKGMLKVVWNVIIPSLCTKGKPP